MPETAFSVLFIFFCLFFFWFLDFAVPDVSGLNIQFKKNNLYKTEAYKMYSIQYIYNYLYSINVHVCTYSTVYIHSMSISEYMYYKLSIYHSSVCVYRNLIVCVSKENKISACWTYINKSRHADVIVYLSYYVSSNQ